MPETAASVFPDLAPAARLKLSFCSNEKRDNVPGVVSRAAKGTPDRGSERSEVALPLERRHDHRAELEVLAHADQLPCIAMDEKRLKQKLHKNRFSLTNYE